MDEPTVIKTQYNRRAHTTHTKNIPGAPSAGDQGDCATAPHRHPVRKATIPRLGDIADLPNTQKQTRGTAKIGR